MAPYVLLLMPELKAALIKPLPDLKATAAKALGSLLKGIGQQYLEDVLPWLLHNRNLLLVADHGKSFAIWVFDFAGHGTIRASAHARAQSCPD